MKIWNPSSVLLCLLLQGGISFAQPGTPATGAERLEAVDHAVRMIRLRPRAASCYGVTTGTGVAGITRQPCVTNAEGGLCR